MRIILISVMIAMHRIVSIIIRNTIAHNRECISVLSLSPGLQKFEIMHNVSKLVNKYNKYEITCRILTGDSKFLAKFYVCRENIFPDIEGCQSFKVIPGGSQSFRVISV